MSGVNFRAQLRSAITNAAYLIKNAPDIMLYKLGLNDSDPLNNSGSPIDNAQKFINQIADTSGETENDANRKIYSSNNFIADGDSRKVAIGKLDAQSLVNADGIQSINDSIGQPDGIAPLDSSGLVPSANLPSFVDDVLEFADLASFPATGDTGKIYVALDTGRIYRWSGSAYIEVSQSPVDSVNGETGTVVLDNTDIGLDNVTNDAQLKREAGDMNTFTEKLAPVVDDIVLIEDSEDAFNKKKVKLQNMLGGGGGGGLDTYYTQDFESFQLVDIAGTGNNATFNNGGTFDGVLALETTNPIDKETSLKYTAGSASNNDWVVVETQTAYDLQRSKTNAIIAQIDASNFSTDFDMIIYDETNSAVIESVTIVGGTSLKSQALSFNIPSTCETISYGFHFNDTPIDTEFVLFDNVELTTDPFKFANINETSELRMEGASTRGSTATSIVIFNSLIKNNGGAFLLESDSTLGTRVTIQKSGVLSVSSTLYHASAGTRQVISKNQVDLTALPTTTEALASSGINSAGSLYSNAAWSGIVEVGDVIRISDNGNPTSDGLNSLNLTLQATSENVVVPSKSNVSDWESFDPFTGSLGAISQGFGVPTNVNMRRRRDGGDLLIQGSFIVGTATAVEGRIAFDENLTSLNSITETIVIGDLIRSAFSSSDIYPTLNSGVSYINFGNAGASGGAFVERNGSDIGSGNKISVNARIPIQGWTSENQFLSLIPFNTEFKTTEQFTGKYWVDGKPIYEISVSGTVANNDLIVSGAETMLEQGGSYLSTGTQYLVFPNEDGALSASFDFDTSTNEIRAFMSATRDVQAFVRYTKV